MKKTILIVLTILMMGVNTVYPIPKAHSVKNRNKTETITTGTASKATGTIYYIRTDGGTASQCTGTTNAPYPGNGTNQPCAWSHPFWALDNSGNWKIKGGDTIIIGSGSYMMGYGAPNTSGLCEASYAYDCGLPPLPSGPDSNNPTRLLGENWDSDCSGKPELWGTERSWHILDLTDSDNIYIDCLEITDHSSCVEFHSNESAECERDNYPFGNWASEGLIASDSENVTIKNLDIHGLASNGIHAGRLYNWTLENVRIAGNGWAGFDGDIDGSDSNSGIIRFENVTIEWNGCGETYPDENPHNCWGQTAGGYGDGLGTGSTGGHWIFSDCTIRYNTSDGLDLLYARETGSQIDIERTVSYNNAGNALKINGNASVENCLLIGYCGYFSGQSFTYHVDNCRAMGNTLNVDLRQGNTVSVVNSTIVGHGDCLVSVECDDESNSCNGSETVIIQNNVFQGYKEFDSDDTTCYIWFDNDNYYSTQLDYNIIYNTKIGNTGYSANDLNKDPLFVNSSLDSFDGHLQTGSPAIDSGLAVGSLNGRIPDHDLEHNTRPSGLGVDRGAYEYENSAASITVTYPNGGETFTVNTLETITWTSSGTVGNVKIEYSKYNGAQWSTIVSSTANDGTYSWTVPTISSPSCLIKISETDGSPTDTSDAVFSITTGGGQAQIGLNRTDFYFGATGAFSTDPQELIISNTGTGSFNWTTSTDFSWLSCKPSSGNGTGTVSVIADPSGLSAGIYTDTITVYSVDATNSPLMVNVTMTIYKTGESSAPFGVFSTPTDGATVMSSIPVTGWVLDDLGVETLKIYRGEPDSLEYIGDAVFVDGARPDVEADYPSYPFNYRAGWGYMMLTNFLPNGGNGTFKIHAIAEDVEGNRVTLGTKTIYCDNNNAVKPFGAIDTPTQGGIASGDAFINWGWALTPQPNTIPKDGSTIGVYVDGVHLGHPVYNIYRADIAGLFPSYANSNGAVGYFPIDTTAYSNGVHSIYWYAVDNAGNKDGIGSRYFLVRNDKSENTDTILHKNAGDGVKGNELLKRAEWNRGPVTIDRFGEKERVYAGETNEVIFTTEPLSPIALNLFPEEGKGKYIGFSQVKDELRSLPIGSTFDKTKGIFYWQPGVGFMGNHRFVFLRMGADEITRCDVVMKIVSR